MTASVITPEQLVEGLDADDLSMPLAVFVANELNEALAHNVTLNGLDRYHADTKCGCLVTTAAKRAGVAIPEQSCGRDFTLVLPGILSEHVNIDADLLNEVASGFTIEMAKELIEYDIDDLCDDYPYATLLGARALLLFREHGGTVRGDEEYGDE